MLLQVGADCTIVDKAGRTAVEVALNLNKTKTTALREGARGGSAPAAECLKLLKERYVCAGRVMIGWVQDRPRKENGHRTAGWQECVFYLLHLGAFTRRCTRSHASCRSWGVVNESTFLLSWGISQLCFYDARAKVGCFE